MTRLPRTPTAAQKLRRFAQKSSAEKRAAIASTLRWSAVNRKARQVLLDLNVLSESGDLLGAIKVSLSTILRSRSPIPVWIKSERLFVRPCTPDITVARVSLSGELDPAIHAASPLQHKFIVDAGGYIGTSAIALAKAFPEATIVSLEPAIENFEILKKNVSGFPNIKPRNVALGANEDTVVLVDRGTKQWGFSVIRSPGWDCQNPMLLYEVKVVTLGMLMEEFGVAGVDLLKLDIEGAEYDLLRDGRSWVSSTRVVVAELHERIIPGTEQAFYTAMHGRRCSINGEKVISY